MIRVGLVGCGGVAPAHIRGWANLADRAQIIAVADPDREARQRRRDQLLQLYNRSSVTEFDDYARLIEQARPDVVDICLPHNLHKDCILAACRAKADWLCEKPLCLTRAEAAEIRQAMSGTAQIGMCAHNQIFMPIVAEARRMIDDGAIGKIFAIQSFDCFIMGLPPIGSLPGSPGVTAVEQGMWRADPQKMGGGELIDTGYHPCYRLLYLARENPAVITAITANHRLKEMQAEDTASLLCRFPSGATGLVHTSWAMELPAHQYPIHVIGERGEIYGGLTRMWYQPTRMTPATIHFDEVDTFSLEIAHFADCVETRAQPVQSYEDGIATLELILRAYESARGHA